MVEKTPLVSVVVPTYNSAPFLRRCLDTVLNQSLKDIEIIAVDDLSTDNTVDILNAYSRQHPSMRVLSLQTKALPGGARNLGLDKAVGRYVSFIDSDDWIDTDFLRLLAQAVEETGASLSVGGVKREYANAQSSTVRYRYNARNVISGAFALALLSKVIDLDVSLSAIVCNKLFRTDFLRASGIRFIENCYNEDDVFTFEVLLRADTVCLTDGVYYHQYQRRNSASRDFCKKHIDDLFLAFSTIRQRLTDSGKFVAYKAIYYAFFEKCLGYLLESLRLSGQGEEAAKGYIKYAFSLCQTAIAIDEFVDCCGSQRIEEFFQLR